MVVRFFFSCAQHQGIIGYGRGNQSSFLYLTIVRMLPFLGLNL